jgi:hypothetical protein
MLAQCQLFQQMAPHFEAGCFVSSSPLVNGLGERGARSRPSSCSQFILLLLSTSHSFASRFFCPSIASCCCDSESAVSTWRCRRLTGRASGAEAAFVGAGGHAWVYLIQVGLLTSTLTRSDGHHQKCFCPVSAWRAPGQNSSVGGDLLTRHAQDGAWHRYKLMQLARVEFD